MAGRVAGKVAFVTGAGRGQGRSHAIRLAEEGADIIAVDILADYATVPYGMATAADLDETVKQVEALDRRIIAAQADVRDAAALKDALDNGAAQLGRLDIVCANAGICTVQTWDEVTPEVWQDTVDTNLTGVWNTMTAAVPHLIAGGGGSIICTSSTAGIKGLPFCAPYVAAKLRPPLCGQAPGYAEPMDAGALIPSTARSLPMAVSAKGARIFDEAGLDYIDASSGPLAVTLGHGHPRVLAALAGQFNAVDYVHRSHFRNPAAERLADLVTGRLGGDLGHVLFVSSGSEANEIAMKFAHMYWAAKGLPDKHRFVSSSVSYHGNTVGALSASGQPRYSANYRPLVRAGETITAPQVYRLPVPEGSTAAAECIARLRREFAQLDLRRTAAVLFEGVGGSGSGVLVPPPGFLEELRRLCDAHDVLWISDEVMSGFGRTGKWFAFQHSGAAPDIVTFAKGAGGGSVPLGGAALSRKVWGQISGVYPAMTGGHTFTNAPLACAAGIATIETLEEERVLDRVADRGAWLGSRLRELQAEFPFVGDVRGVGYLWGVEFVADPATAEPPDPALDVTAKAIAAAAASRLLVYPARYCVDGTRGDAILVGPPLTATDEELEELLTRLRTTLTTLAPVFRTP